jgi:hypothetical protein
MVYEDWSAGGGDKRFEQWHTHTDAQTGLMLRSFCATLSSIFVSEHIIILLPSLYGLMNFYRPVMSAVAKIGLLADFLILF